MKKCMICNSTYAGDDQFCHNDGSVLVMDSSDTPTVVMPGPGRATSYASGTSKPSSAAGWTGLVIGILVGLVVVFAFYKQLNESEKQSPAQNSNNTRASTAVTATSTPMPPTESSRIVQVTSPGDRYLAPRSEPDHVYGNKILEIPHGEQITLGECQPDFVTIDKRKGRWCKTSYRGYIGWIFDAFVRY